VPRLFGAFIASRQMLSYAPVMRSDPSVNRGMLAGLFSGKHARQRRLRELVVDLKAPLTGGALAGDGFPRLADPDTSGNLNEEQRRAVYR
jgi:hypothetical protein